MRERAGAEPDCDSARTLSTWVRRWVIWGLRSLQHCGFRTP